jgi:hypothetical protein
LNGWVFDPHKRVCAINFIAEDKKAFSLRNFNLESPDLAAVHGAQARTARFSEVRRLVDGQRPRREASLSVMLSDRSEIIIPSIGQAALRGDPVYGSYGKFLELLRTVKPGHFLEIGSRARSGIVALYGV